MIYLDFETHLAKPALQAPPPVCAQVLGVEVDTSDPWTIIRRGIALVHARSTQFADVVAVCFNGRVVAFNAAYECLVAMQYCGLVDVVLRAGSEERIYDPRVAEQLIWIAEGRPMVGHPLDLGAICARYRIEGINKENPWRLRYSELADTPPSEWPNDAIEYAIRDVEALPTLVASQNARAEKVGQDLAWLGRATTHALARDLISAHGLRTDPRVVAVYEAATQERIDRAGHVLRKNGLAWIDQSNALHRCESKMRKWVERQVDNNYPRTKSGPRLDKTSLELLDHPIAAAYSEVSQATTALSRVDDWRAATKTVAHPRFDMTENLRSRSARPQVQNRPTAGIDRECVAPGPGLVYLISDHSGLELDCHGQNLLELIGWSRLADARREGRDLHAIVGANVLGIEVEELQRRRKLGDIEAFHARQVGKRANFTFQGGGGAGRIAIVAWAQDRLRLHSDHATNVREWGRVKKAWLEAWPEHRGYFQLANAIARGDRRLRLWWNGVVRGRVGFCDAANGPFSARAACLTHDVLWRLQVATRDQRVADGALFGCRVENFVHDEYLLAVPHDEYLDQRAAAFQAIIVDTAREWLPDLEPRADVEAARRWGKRVRRVEYANGRLGVWEWHDLIDAIWRATGGEDATAQSRTVIQHLGDITTAKRKELDARLMAATNGWNQGLTLEQACAIAQAVRTEIE